MKILWHSNAPYAPSGYGVQTKRFVPELQRLGHDIAISAFYGVRGTHTEWDGMHVYPGVADPYGGDILTPHALDHFGELRAGLIITLMDIFVLDPALFDKSHAACWVPIDHEPVPPAVANWFKRASHVTPIAMSRFGQRELQRELGADRLVGYVPHGVDTEVYRPYDDARRQAARKEFGVDDPDTFVVGMVAANQAIPSRKGFPEAFRAFARFHRQHPNSLLYVHTERDGRFGGFNLLPLLDACGLGPDSVRFVPQYRYITGNIGDDYMAAAYNSMDVLLNPAMGEGFGVPILEAQACGTPVIVTGNTAQVEVGDAGWHVGGQEFWTTQHSWQVIPSIDDIASVLVEAARGMAARMRCRAREHAMQYDVQTVTREHWVPLLAQLEERMQVSGGEYLVPDTFNPVVAS